MNQYNFKTQTSVQIRFLLKKQNMVLESIAKNQTNQTYWVCKKKAAQLYGVSLKTIYNWSVSGGLKTKEFNGKTYYSILPLVND
jgi:hypothetical protein